MLKRKIEGVLKKWKDTEGHKPLIIKGCRQCGKTFSVRQFAQENYAHEIYLNFYENKSYASVFSGSLEVDHLTMLISALLGSEAIFEVGKTVVILDEIQECPEARTALKFFAKAGKLRERRKRGTGVPRDFQFGNDFHMAALRVFDDFRDVFFGVEMRTVKLAFRITPHRAHFREFRPALEVDAPALVFAEVEVELVHVVHGHHVDIDLHRIQGEEMAAGVEVHATVAEIWPVSYSTTR